MVTALFSFPKTLIQLNEGAYFTTGIANSNTRLTKVNGDGTPVWTLYKGDMTLPIFISSCVENESHIICSGWRRSSAIYAIGGYIYSLTLSHTGTEQNSYFNYSELGWIEGNTIKGICQSQNGFSTLGFFDISPNDTDHVMLNYVYADPLGNKVVDTNYDIFNNHTLVTESAIADEDGTTLFCVGRVYPYQPKVFNISDIILLKIDTLGNILWTKMHGSYEELLQPKKNAAH